MILSAFHVSVLAESADPGLKPLQGVWRNAAGGDDEASRVTVTIDQNRIEFQGVQGEWYKGTFEINSKSKPLTMRATIVDGSIDAFKGLSSNGIYRFDGKKLILTGRRPGDDGEPEGFDDPKCRTLELTK